MQREEFVEKYNAIVERVLYFNKKAHFEGLPALGEIIDEKKVLQRDIFEFGICLRIRKTDKKIIDEILDLFDNRKI